MLTDEQVQQFREDGYLVFAALIQGERLAYYKQVFDELVAEGCKLTEQVPHWSLELDERGEPQAGLLHKVQGVCVVDARVLELAREPAILDRVAVLIGENIDVFGTKFFPKLPNGGTSTGWHQDNFLFWHRYGSHYQLRDLSGRFRCGEWVFAGGARQPPDGRDCRAPQRSKQTWQLDDGR